MKSFLASCKFAARSIGARFSLGLQVLAAVTLVTAHNLLQVGGLKLAPLSLGLTAEEENRTANNAILKNLDGIAERLKKLDAVEKTLGEQAITQAEFAKVLAEAQKAAVDFRKQMLEVRSARVRRGGEVSEGCARFIGAVYLQGAVIQGKIAEDRLERVQKIIGDVLGKAALTSSDIPLTIDYSGEVAELVYEFGVARKIGTVIPLGAASFRLPKLTTSPTFGLIAGSGTVTERSPVLVFVAFTPEKFGGLIRMPSEIDEDSIVAMGQFLARYAARQMAQVEDYNFFRSTGAASGQNGTAEGLTKSVVTDTMTYSNGGTTTSGKTKASEAVLADFRNLRTIPNGAVLGRAKYAMHQTYEALLVSFNTSSTVQPYVRGTAGSPATLDGFEIVWVPDMPAFSTSAAVSVVHALFGDFTFNYLGVRRGMAFDTSREAGFTTDEILVRVLERFTIGKMATDCVAGLRNAAS